jgi:hypothetical protein
MKREESMLEKSLYFVAAAGVAAMMTACKGGSDGGGSQGGGNGETSTGSTSSSTSSSTAGAGGSDTVLCYIANNVPLCTQCVETKCTSPLAPAEYGPCSLYQDCLCYGFSFDECGFHGPASCEAVAKDVASCAEAMCAAPCATAAPLPNSGMDETGDYTAGCSLTVSGGVPTETLTKCNQLVVQGTQLSLSVFGATQGIDISYSLPDPPQLMTYSLTDANGLYILDEYTASSGSPQVGSATLTITSMSGNLLHGTLSATMILSHQMTGPPAMVEGSF